VSNETQQSPRSLLKRRNWLCGAVGIGALNLTAVRLGATDYKEKASLTKDQRDKLTPDQVIDGLKKGNERFRSGTMVSRDLVAQKKASAGGQFPAAVILGCIDSRAPAEIITDSGIGDTFNARVAGNVVNDDILGSMEFACQVAGAKVVLVLGHTACGAIKGAIDDVVLGNLTGLLARIKPAIAATDYKGQKSSSNPAYVDAVARANVVETVKTIHSRSKILDSMEQKKEIKIVGAMYDLSTGVISFT
jgi:carbonic anhydrase